MGKLKFLAYCAVLVLAACSKSDKWSKVTIDEAIDHPFFHENTWSYPWYILKNDEGNFESAIDSAINPSDTLPVYHTLRATSNYQGEHMMTDCAAYVEADTLVLLISDPLPAYTGGLTIKVYDGEFYAFFRSIPFFYGGKADFYTKKQQLALKKEGYGVGDSIKGKCHVEFEERYEQNGEVKVNSYSIDAVIKTKVENRF